MKRVLVTAVLLTLLAAPSPAPGQERTPRQRVDRILTTSSVEDFLRQAGEQVVAVVVPSVPPADSSRVHAALAAAFVADSMRRTVIDRMAAAATAPVLDDLEGWLFEGPVARMAALRDAHEPDVDLETYARSLQTDPPEAAKLRAVAQHAQVQNAAGFYVLVQEVTRQTLEAVQAALSGEPTRFAPLSDAEYGRALEGYFNVAVVSFLQQYEPVPVDLLAAATERYASPAGQWYVEQYSRAVAAALENAGERAVAQLRR